LESIIRGGTVQELLTGVLRSLDVAAQYPAAAMQAEQAQRLAPEAVRWGCI